MRRAMHTVHNARIKLRATACNNLGLAVIVATLIAPAIGGQFLGNRSIFVMLAWVALGITLHLVARLCLEAAAMTWEQTFTWLIWPAFVTLGIAIAAVVASRYIP